MRGLLPNTGDLSPEFGGLPRHRLLSADAAKGGSGWDLGRVERTRVELATSAVRFGLPIHGPGTGGRCDVSRYGNRAGNPCQAPSTREHREFPQKTGYRFVLTGTTGTGRKCTGPKSSWSTAIADR